MPQQTPFQGAPQMPRQPAPQAGGYIPPRLKAPPKAPSAEPPAPRLARGARPSEPARRTAAIPTPEELGISGNAPRSAALDWAAAQRRMDDLGVTGFKLENVPGGGARFTCWVGTEMVHADGANKAEAVRLCLDRLKPRVADRR